MTSPQLADFTRLFGAEAQALFEETTWRDRWATRLSGLTMASDSYLPFRDNIDYAASGA